MDHILKTMNKGDKLLSGGSLLNIRVLIRQQKITFRMYHYWRKCILNMDLCPVDNYRDIP